MSRDIIQSLPKRVAKKLLIRMGIPGFGSSNDLAGYDAIISFLERHQVWKVAGDVLEIGAFMGGGTRKLGEWAAKYGKRILVIDIFEIDADCTATVEGCVMRDLYARALNGRDLWSLFVQNTKDLRNLVVFRNDSKLVTLDPSLRLCFAFIDGNHDYTYVWNDFRLAWRHLSPGGWVGFHDYGHDLPLVTKAIDEILNLHKTEIARVERIESMWMIFLQKSEDSAKGLI